MESCRLPDGRVSSGSIPAEFELWTSWKASAGDNIWGTPMQGRHTFMGIVNEILGLRQDQLSSVTRLIAALDRQKSAFTGCYVTLAS